MTLARHDARRQIAADRALGPRPCRRAARRRRPVGGRQSRCAACRCRRTGRPGSSSASSSASCVGIIALWEIGGRSRLDRRVLLVAAERDLRDADKSSSPTGDAFTDIGFTFRSTILGFLHRHDRRLALGLSFWWSRNYAAIVQPYIICFESLPKLALAPLIVLVFGIGLASKVAIATALTLVVSTLTTYAGVKAVDPDGEKLFYSLGATRWQVFRKLVIPSCLPWIISVLRVNIGLALTGADRRRVHRLPAWSRPRHPLCRPDLRHRAGVGRGRGALGARVVMYVAVSWLERCCAKA